MKMNSTGNKKKNHQPVKVYVRQRPFSDHEVEMHCPNIIQHLTHTELVIKLGFHEKRYGFDQVFSEETSQKEIYDTVVAPLVSIMILGYNCTVFAYGQTGTGKTYTMIGNKMLGVSEESSNGLIPRSLCHLFTELDRLSPNVEYTVRVSFIEIYNEEVRDLLSTGNVQVKIFEDSDKGSVCLKGVKEETVFSVEEALSWLNIGVTERQTASTTMNRHSSRSHSIFILSVLSRQLTVDGEELIKAGKLYLVDLAGSENIGRSGSTDMRIREAGNINKSLLTLGKVIKALAQNAQHVPYRDSKLTRILRDSLGGRTKTCMIATISAAANVWDETISTLDYAQVARNVSNCPQINENRKQAVILKDLKDEIARLRKELAVARAGEGFYMCKESYEKLCDDLKRSQDDIVENRKKVSELTRSNQILELENCSLKEQLQKLSLGYEQVKRELEEKKLQSKRAEYILEYLDKRETELKSTADQLRKVCELSTKHEDLFFNKYEKQCEATLKNAFAARNAFCAYNDSLELLRKVTLSYDENQKSSLDEIQNHINCLKEINRKVFTHLSACTKKLQLDPHSDSFTVDKRFVSNFDKYFDVLFNPNFFEAQKSGIEDLEQYNKSKIQEVEVMTSRCVNTVKQVLNDFFLCVGDVLTTHGSLACKVKAAIEDSEIGWKNVVINTKEVGTEFVRSSLEDISKRVACHIRESNMISKNLSQEVDDIKSQYMKESENKISDISANCETIRGNFQSYKIAVEKVGGQVFEKFRKELNENVQFITHSGDTPAKRTYSYPSKIEERLPTLVLYRQCDESED